MVDSADLEGTLDLWMCMWTPDEQERFETAVIRALTDDNSRMVRLLALAACQLLASERLRAAADHMAEKGVFLRGEVEQIAAAVESLRERVQLAQRLRGNILAVEILLVRVVTDELDREADRVLDCVDVRDLVAVARTTLDARLFREVERRVARRGKYQRGRVANLLGFTLRPGVAPHVVDPPQLVAQRR